MRHCLTICFHNTWVIIQYYHDIAIPLYTLRYIMKSSEPHQVEAEWIEGNISLLWFSNRRRRGSLCSALILSAPETRFSWRTSPSLHFLTPFPLTFRCLSLSRLSLPKVMESLWPWQVNAAALCLPRPQITQVCEVMNMWSKPDDWSIRPTHQTVLWESQAAGRQLAG